MIILKAHFKRNIGILSIICGVALAVLLVYSPYVWWEAVNIPGCGEIKVPGDWECSVQDGRLQFYEDDLPIMVQAQFVNSDGTLEYRTTDGQLVSAKVKLEQSVSFSNSAAVGVCSCLVGTESRDIRFVEFAGNAPYVYFLITETSVRNTTIKRIARSYKSSGTA